MIGDKYIAIKNCEIGVHKIRKGEVLTEFGTYNFATETYDEEGGEYNELKNNSNLYVCDVGSRFVKENFRKT